MELSWSENEIEESTCVECGKDFNLVPYVEMNYTAEEKEQ